MNTKFGPVQRIVVLLLILFVGAGAGVISAIMTNASIDRYIQSLQNDVNLINLSETRPQPLPGTYEEAVSQVYDKAWPAIATVYPLQDESDNPLVWGHVSDHLGAGAVVTSDGWLLFHEDAFAVYGISQTEIRINGDVYIPEQVVRDSITHAVLVKVDAHNLPVLAFGASQEMDGGDILFRSTGPYTVFATSLIDAYTGTSTMSAAEQVRSSWLIQDPQSEAAPLFNAASELVAVGAGEEYIPVHHLLSFIDSVLAGGEAQHAGFGAYTVHLPSMIGVSSTFPEGELISVGSNERYAVLPDGPAEQAGLRAGDIILQCANQRIDGQHTLADILMTQKPDKDMICEYWRDGEVQEITVHTGVFESLLY